MKLKQFLTGYLLGIPFAVGLIPVIDAVEFHAIQRGTYTTPWYDARWWKQPYTNARVMMAGHTERWTKNAVGDDWLVRESNIDGKQWWTVLKKIDR